MGNSCWSEAEIKSIRQAKETSRDWWAMTKVRISPNNSSIESEVERHFRLGHSRCIPPTPRQAHVLHLRSITMDPPGFDPAVLQGLLRTTYMCRTCIWTGKPDEIILQSEASTIHDVEHYGMGILFPSMVLQLGPARPGDSGDTRSEPSYHVFTPRKQVQVPSQPTGPHSSPWTCSPAPERLPGTKSARMGLVKVVKHHVVFH